MDAENTGTTEGSSSPAPDEPFTLREKLLAYGILVLGGTVVIGLTVLATAFVVLFASDIYVGGVAAADRGIHGTELVTSAKAPSTVGTFTSDDGSTVLEGTKLSWDASDVGSVVPCQYVPSLRDGHLTVVVTRGWAADIILSSILLVICLAVGWVGWWLLGSVVFGSRKT